MRFALAIGLAILAATQRAAAKPPLQCTGFEDLTSDLIERPEKPACLYSMESPPDQRSFDSCSAELDTYRLKITGYLECLKAEQADAVREFNADVEQFNCKARGGKRC